MDVFSSFSISSLAKLLVVPSLVALSFSVTPVRTEHQRIYSSPKTLVVKTIKTIPPRVAFESIAQENEKPVAHELFKAEAPSINLNRVIGERRLRPTAISLKRRSVSLPAMTVAAAEPVQQQIQISKILSISNRRTDERSTPQPVDLKQFPVSDAEKGAQTQFNLQGGLSLSGTMMAPDDNLEVFWQVEGQPQLSAQIVREPDYRYKIQVDRLIGVVAAQLFNSKGFLKAEGTYRLGRTLNSKADIVLYPTDSIASFPVDTYKDPARLFTAPAFAAKSQRKTSARVSFSPHESFISDSQNQFRIEGASRRSESLFAIDREGYAPALGLGRTGAASPIPLLPEKTVAALKSILSEIRKSSSRRPDTLIYGQATLDGAPIEGVSVQIQGSEEAKPVYLNELFIPDSALTQTASHGLFVFEGLDEGYYSFVGQRSSQFFGFGNAVTSLETVSYLNLQGHRTRYPMGIKSYQAFNSEEVSTTITLQGSGFPLDVLGTGLIEHPSTAALEIAKVEPQDLRYATTIVPFWGEDDHLFAPLVSREWLAKISTEAQVAVSPDAGVVLGFVEKGVYEIFWPHLAKDYPVQIIYFDREGLKSLAPVDGGGFIAFNIPPSAQTLVLQDRFGFVASRVIPVDAGVLTTLIF